MSGNTSWWHDDTLAQSLDCAENQTSLISPGPTWQCLELCWHLVSLSGLILWLCSHGVRGKAWVAMATPVDRAIELWGETTGGRGGGGSSGNSSASRSLCLNHPHSFKCSFSPASMPSHLSLSLTLLLIWSLLTGVYFNLGNKSATAINVHFLIFLN